MGRIIGTILGAILAIWLALAAAVAGRAFPFTRTAQVTLPALINGAAGTVTGADGRPITLVGFTITGAKIVAIDLIDDPRRIAEADLAILGR